MGSQVKAICKCGVESEILIGGGKLNFTRVQYFPCQCKNCKDVVQVNIKSRKLKCPNCKEVVIPYNDAVLIGVAGKEVIAQSFDDIITDGTYYCPSCESMTLHFETGTLLWD